MVGEAVERRREVIVRERTNLEVRRNFFTVRVEKTWNAMPETLKAQWTVNIFKNEYDSWRKRAITINRTEDHQPALEELTHRTG